MWRYFYTKQKSYLFTLFDCVWLCTIVWFTLTLFFIFKTKKWPVFFWFFWSYVTTQGICNKFIEMKISVGCIVCQILMRCFLKMTFQITPNWKKVIRKSKWPPSVRRILNVKVVESQELGSDMSASKILGWGIIFWKVCPVDYWWKSNFSVRFCLLYQIDTFIHFLSFGENFKFFLAFDIFWTF